MLKILLDDRETQCLFTRLDAKVSRHNAAVHVVHLVQTEGGKKKGCNIQTTYNGSWF